MSAGPETQPDDLGAAWAAAEVLCATILSASGYPATPKLLGPFPTIGRPRTYQAGVWDFDGKRYEDYFGLGETPAAALRDLISRLADAGEGAGK